MAVNEFAAKNAKSASDTSEPVIFLKWKKGKKKGKKLQCLAWPTLVSTEPHSLSHSLCVSRVTSDAHTSAHDTVTVECEERINKTKGKRDTTVLSFVFFF